MTKIRWYDPVEDCRRYYMQHAAGGSLHIVLDDGNIDDRHVSFCITWAIEHDDPEGAALGVKLYMLSERQRKKLYDNYDLYSFWGPIRGGR